MLCFWHANRGIELKFVHSLDYSLDFGHFSSLKIVEWSIVFLEIAKVRYYENFLKLFKSCRDAIELVFAVINKHCVASKVYCKHKPVSISPDKRVIIFSVHKYHNISSEELVVFSYEVIQIRF